MAFESLAGQIYSKLLEQIRNGILSPGCRLPPEVEFASQLNISRKTLRLALARLEEQKLIVRTRKMGTYVADKGHHLPTASAIANLAKHRNIKHKLLIIHSNLPHNSSSYMSQPALDYCGQLGVETVLLSYDILMAGNIEERFSWMQNQHFTGVLLLQHSYSPTSPILRLTDYLTIPIVMPFAWDTDLVLTPFFTISISPRIAILKGLNYLYNHGHRVVSFLGMQTQNTFTSNDFHNVTEYELCLLSTQKSVSIAYAEENLKSVDSALETLLANPERPTAILCYNATIAICAIDCLKKRKIRVPEDISILSFSDRTECQYVDPPVSAICLPLATSCIAAIDFILNGDYRQAALPKIEITITDRKSIKTIN